MPSAITILGKEYAVEALKPISLFGNRPGGYLLTGARGAIYSTLRYHMEPDYLFVIAATGRSPFQVLLTDKDGPLRVTRRTPRLP
jgi:hypothetical protein